MNIFELSIGLIAPHRCLICRDEGKILCDGCTVSSIKPLPSRCYRCHGVTKQSSVCISCRNSVKINHVWVAAEYEDTVKKLLYKLKFDRAKSGSIAIAEIISDSLPNLPKDVIISHIPTANNRVRVRGYDQAELIARELSRIKGWKRQSLLVRTGKSRQVGAGRKERFAHLEQALKIRKSANIIGKHILLVDDVTTTGATIESAAKILKNSGAKTIDIAVFAQPSKA